MELTHPPGTLAALIGDVAKINDDLRKIRNYVKERLFPRIIFMFDDDQMKEGTWMHKDYMKNCRSILGFDTNGEELQEEVRDGYMKYLWTVMGRDKSYKTWLSTKRSNTYQAVQDKFMRKYSMITPMKSEQPHS